MPSRCPHNKSRHGCYECKKRRIKCDEKRPSCLHCLNRKVACEYPSVLPISWYGKKRVTRAQPASAISSTSFPREVPAMAEKESDHLPPMCDVRQLELMTQWCTSTYRSVSRCSSVELIWQDVIPRESFRHVFLCHGILAVSALHLSITGSGDQQPEEYRELAQIYHTKAVAGLTLAVSSLEQGEYDAIYAASNLIIILLSHDLIQVFRVVWSSMGVLQQIISWVRVGKLGPLIQNAQPNANCPTEVYCAIQSLKKLNFDLAKANDHHEVMIFEAVINQLKVALSAMSRNEEATRTIFLWIFSIPARFVDMMHQRLPFALVILAHYSVVLCNMGRRLWWMGEWGPRIIQEIQTSLCEKWREKLAWVEQQQH
ncbi:hypothetical protein BDW71DRAFT_200875 [Aspergillus fruticulosus]